MPPVRVELTTPGLRDQCSNHWAIGATAPPCLHISIYTQACLYMLPTEFFISNLTFMKASYKVLSMEMELLIIIFYPLLI